MNQVVVVFSFPEPETELEYANTLLEAKKFFADMPDVKILLAIKEAAEMIMAVFDTPQIPDSNLVAHAKRELALLGEKEDDGFNAAILNSVRGFASYGHSGGSASVGISMVNELLQFNNLTPLTDNPNEWVHREPGVAGPYSIWQNSRNSKAFSKDGGKTYTLLSDDNNNNGSTKTIHYSAEHIAVD